MKKRVFALLLSAAMALSMLAGCSSKPTAPSTPLSGAQAPASQSKQEPKEREVVKLRMIMYGDMTARREEFFKKDFHDKVLNDLQIDLSIEYMPWGSTATVGTMLASGEKFAVWNVVGTFGFSSKGYLAEIPMEQIEEHCQNLIRVRGERNGFECTILNDKIYAIPFGSKAYAGAGAFLEVRNDILKSVGHEASKITTYDQLMEAIAAVKEKYPDMRIIRRFIGYDCLNGALSDKNMAAVPSEGQMVFLRPLEDDDKVYSLFDSKEFENLCRKAAKWVEKGYQTQDILTNPTQGDADWAAGNCLLTYGSPSTLVSDAYKTTVPESENALIKIGDLPLVKNRDYDWAFSISASDSENVERWLDLFDWIYKDKETYNFCIYGVEGKDWKYKEDGTIEKLVTDSFIDSWFMEAMEYNTYPASVSKENIERYKNNDANAKMSKSVGFAFDSTPVAVEAAMLSAVYTEIVKPMATGFLDFDENYEKLMFELDKAGYDKYVAEYQKQFSAWYAQKKQ